ncbi:hypothetical protein like AT5G43240 [Hibiscus trionum]|uniref:DUF674 domain-containing protein n=1 Tax=Hibiscus trionum TaxID=183268 RepID=A0A9W7HNN3_HIBTR|nr:hypothetical protein like AT5G43240 [Hibiscus trionum]
MVSSSPTSVSLKLLIDSKSNRLVFAEAGKDFVDFIFSIMSLPVGTVIRLLGKQGTAGCIRNIYESIENLGSSYMLSKANKDILLKAQALNYAAYEPLLLPSIQPPAYTDLYRCSSSGGNVNCRMYIANNPNSRCTSCNSLMNRNFTFVNLQNNVGEGFVKEAATYMITDDLVVRPIATSSIVTLLNKYNIKDVRDLEEKVIAVGVDEGVKLLKASLQSKTVLTDVFLEKKAGESDVSNSGIVIEENAG